MNDTAPLELAYTTDPCVICQPLGAVYASVGFHRCLALLHGSQGCVAYLRSQLIRTFREEILNVSSSLNEEAAVYGGEERLVEAVKNAIALYDPSLLMVFSTCLSETIGDDLQGIVRRMTSEVDLGIPIIAVPTPSYKHDHIHGFESAIIGILEYFFKLQKDASQNGKLDNQLTLIPGYANPGDVRELKRLVSLFADVVTISDIDETLISPRLGDSFYADGGTTIEDVYRSFNSKKILCCQHFVGKKIHASVSQTLKLDTEWLFLPVGIRLTDRMVQLLSTVTNKEVPATLTEERRELVDAIKAAKQYVFDRRVAIFENPDIALGMASLCVELGLDPVIVATNRKEHRFRESVMELMKGRQPTIIEDTNHFEYRRAIEQYVKEQSPIDLLVGNTRSKYIEHDLNIPLVRVGFPYSDRVGVARNIIVGYRGMMRLADEIGNCLIRRNDKNVEAVI
jgi:nitrogenase molybdenum-iron protein beta chain